MADKYHIDDLYENVRQVSNGGWNCNPKYLFDERPFIRLLGLGLGYERVLVNAASRLSVSRTFTLH
jgi:hypothetical protein